MHGDGKTILITGSTDGIGLSHARRAVTVFDKVILHGRNPEKCEAVKAELIRIPECKAIVTYEVCDFFYTDRVLAMIEKICIENRDLYAIVNNAGIFNTMHELNPWGIESMYAVNHLAAFIIQTAAVKYAERIRHIINTGSLAHLHAKFDPDTACVAPERFNCHKAYAMSKLCCIMQSCMYDQNAAEKKIQINCYDPGFLNTKLTRNGWNIHAEDDLSSAVEDVFFILNEFCDGFGYIKNKQRMESSKESLRKEKWEQMTAFNKELIARVKNDRPD